ncbi:hypothetical protein ABK040_010809 [Willaertia magna]
MSDNKKKKRSEPFVYVEEEEIIDKRKKNKEDNDGSVTLDEDEEEEIMNNNKENIENGKAQPLIIKPLNLRQLNNNITIPQVYIAGMKMEDQLREIILEKTGKNYSQIMYNKDDIINNQSNNLNNQAITNNTTIDNLDSKIKKHLQRMTSNRMISNSIFETQVEETRVKLKQEIDSLKNQVRIMETKINSSDKKHRNANKQLESMHMKLLMTITEKEEFLRNLPQYHKRLVNIAMDPNSSINQFVGVVSSPKRSNYQRHFGEDSLVYLEKKKKQMIEHKKLVRKVMEDYIEIKRTIEQKEKDRKVDYLKSKQYTMDSIKRQEERIKDLKQQKKEYLETIKNIKKRMDMYSKEEQFIQVLQKKINAIERILIEHDKQMEIEKLKLNELFGFASKYNSDR